MEPLHRTADLQEAAQGFVGQRTCIQPLSLPCDSRHISVLILCSGEQRSYHWCYDCSQTIDHGIAHHGGVASYAAYRLPHCQQSVGSSWISAAPSGVSRTEIEDDCERPWYLLPAGGCPDETPSSESSSIGLLQPLCSSAFRVGCRSRRGVLVVILGHSQTT